MNATLALAACLLAAPVLARTPVVEFDQQVPVSALLRQAKEAVKHDASPAPASAAAPLPFQPIDWVTIPGGSFQMGGREDANPDALPGHRVTVKTFELSKTPVTVEQYAACVAAGACATPEPRTDCNWAKPGREKHPMTCLTWFEADAYAKYAGGRLPSESEFEYAATDAGRNRYPWGWSEPDCDKAVMYGTAASCTDGNGTLPVCSRPAGNVKLGTGAQLCDMSGNVWEWVQDWYHRSYEGAPTDGSAWETAPDMPARVQRGGSFTDRNPVLLRADDRSPGITVSRYDNSGFRVAR